MTVSRQRRWQIIKQRAGLCVRCGGARECKSPECVGCREKDAARMRRRAGHQPWRPGGRGRPPFSAKK